MKKLIIGSNDFSTSTLYQKLQLPPSELVTQTNIGYSIGHTSLQEFNSIHEFIDVLLEADEIYWGFPSENEFFNKNEYYNLLDLIRNHQTKYKNVVNFSQITFDEYNWKMAMPTTNLDDIVFFGCSFTVGVGLPSKDECYTNILSTSLGKYCINLAKGGGSNNRSFDLFSQMSFEPGQIVIMQITEMARIRYCTANNELKDFQFRGGQPFVDHRALLTIYNDNFLLYELLVKLRMVINIARKCNLKFLFWFNDYKSIDRRFLTYFYEYPEFVPAYIMENYMVDVGDDNLHPGIESHKFIANTLMNYFMEIYEI